MLTKTEIEQLEVLSLENRQNVIKMVYAAQSGHIGGSLSACDILTVLFHKCMKHAVKGKLSPEYGQRDRFVLSKGHVSPVYYSILAQLGFFEKDELMSFSKLGTRLQGHPSMWTPGVEVAPGFMQAGHRKLDNLVAIIDRNGLQIDGNTENIMALDNLPDKIRAFNWNVLEINGHDMNEIYNAIEQAKSANAPTCIIAHTIKGKGVSFMENNAGWHGKAPAKEDYEKAIKELI